MRLFCQYVPYFLLCIKTNSSSTKISSLLFKMRPGASSYSPAEIVMLLHDIITLPIATSSDATVIEMWSQVGNEQLEQMKSGIQCSRQMNPWTCTHVHEKKKQIKAKQKYFLLKCPMSKCSEGRLSPVRFTGGFSQLQKPLYVPAMHLFSCCSHSACTSSSRHGYFCTQDIFVHEQGRQTIQERKICLWKHGAPGMLAKIIARNGFFFFIYSSGKMRVFPSHRCLSFSIGIQPCRLQQRTSPARY